MKKLLLLLTFYFSLFTLSAQTITTVAGNGTQGYSGDGGQATDAEIDQPIAVSFDNKGNMYISESLHQTIRMVNTSGIISTFAGNGVSGYSGDGGPATAAEFSVAWCVISDAKGNIYFSDTYNGCVRKIDTSGIITTIAGNGGAGYTGDGGQATAAQIGTPGPLLFDVQGNLYIGDWSNSVIRKVGTNDTITTFAGTGTPGYTGDGGPATAAGFLGIYDMAFDASGNMFIADNPYRIREVSNTGYVSTVAGISSDGGCGGDGAPAANAKLKSVRGLAFDNTGNMFISDMGCQDVRMITLPQYIYTIAGVGVAGYNGDGIPANYAALNTPEGMAFDASGSLYIADAANNRIRKIPNPKALGVEPITMDNVQCTIFPNPNNGQFSVQLSSRWLSGASGQKNAIEIYNMLGEKVYSKELSTVNCKLSIEQPAGIYLYRIISQTGSVVGTGKFVVE